jgi:ketosteroid isomerase-like protein
METTTDARSIVATYFRAWKERDFVTLRGILADDVTFHGPLATLDNADDCVKGLRGMAEILDDIVVQHVFVDGPDVLTWFDLHTTVAPPAPTANWQHVEDGRITRIRVAFDPRALTGSGP